MKSIAQLITEGRSRWQAGSDYEASMARDLWLQDTWPDIEANLRAAGELLEAVDALGQKPSNRVAAAAEKLRAKTNG